MKNLSYDNRENKHFQEKKEGVNRNMAGGIHRSRHTVSIQGDSVRFEGVHGLDFEIESDFYGITMRTKDR